MEAQLFLLQKTAAMPSESISSFLAFSLERQPFAVLSRQLRGSRCSAGCGGAAMCAFQLPSPPGQCRQQILTEEQ